MLRSEVLNLDRFPATAVIAELVDIAIDEIADPVTAAIERGEDGFSFCGRAADLGSLRTRFRRPRNNTEQIFFALSVTLAPAYDNIIGVRRVFVIRGFK